MGDEDLELPLKNAILSYLNKCNFLESIETTCGGFSIEALTPALYPFTIDVDINRMLEEDGELCRFILKKPVKGRKLFQEVIYAIINTLQWLPSLENVAQLLVTIKITSLPPFPEFQISCFQDLRKSPFPQYYQLNGIIVAQTTPSIYTKGMRLVCPDLACVGSSGCKFVRVHDPDTRERQTIRNDLKCNFCGATLKEDVKARILSEKLVAEMVPIEGFGGTDFHGRQQFIPVYFKDELIEDVRLGSRYSVIGLTAGVSCLPLPSEEQIHLEADHGWPITFQQFEIKERPSRHLDLLKSKIESELQRLGLDDARSSPYLLPLVISYHFGEHIIAKGLFHKLKLGILLALATCGCAAAKGNMSLLTLGSDTSVSNRLLIYGRSMAPRMATLTDQQQLKVSVTRDTESGRFRTEANPILLASGGVCYCGDLGKLGVAAQRTLAKIMETDSVELDSWRDNYFQGSNHRLPPKEYPVECQVWAYGSRSPRKPTGAERVFKNSGAADVQKRLLDAFSITYYTDSWSAFDNDHKDALAMLSTFATALDSDEDGSLYTHEELQMFLRLVRRRNVIFETEAEQLIKGYYVASRRLRNSAKNCTEIAITAVTSISSLAEAHARLSLRPNVIEEDAIAAIFLYEEYLTSKYGASCFNVQPFSHLLQRGECEDLKTVLEQHEAFATNLRSIVSAYGNDSQETEITREE